YPYQNALAYSEGLLGIAVIVAPVQWIFGNPTLTYNVATLLSFLIAGVGMYLLARELTGSAAAALVGALAFAFAPYRWAQLNHVQVLSTGWIPLALWALHRALKRPSLATVTLVGAFAMLQLLSYAYSAFLLAPALAIVGVCSLV